MGRLITYASPRDLYTWYRTQKNASARIRELIDVGKIDTECKQRVWPCIVRSLSSHADTEEKLRALMVEHDLPSIGRVISALIITATKDDQ